MRARPAGSPPSTSGPAPARPTRRRRGRRRRRSARAGPIGAGVAEGSTSPTEGLEEPPAVSPVLLAALKSALDLPIVDRTNYAVLAEYARGGLGRIVRARDKRTGRVVAIKEMLGS